MNHSSPTRGPFANHFAIILPILLLSLLFTFFVFLEKFFQLYYVPNCIVWYHAGHSFAGIPHNHFQWILLHRHIHRQQEILFGFAVFVDDAVHNLLHDGSRSQQPHRDDDGLRVHRAAGLHNLHRAADGTPLHRGGGRRGIFWKEEDVVGPGHLVFMKLCSMYLLERNLVSNCINIGNHF